MGLDADSESVLRDVLVLFSHHPREWLTPQDTATRTGRPADSVRPMMSVLASSFVLDFDDATGAYRYSGDVVLGYEIDTFRKRVDSQHSHVSSNVARFRERHGY